MSAEICQAEVSAVTHYHHLQLRCPEQIHDLDSQFTSTDAAQRTCKVAEARKGSMHVIDCVASGFIKGHS